jgi:hypothetical protein
MIKAELKMKRNVQKNTKGNSINKIRQYTRNTGTESMCRGGTR